MSKNQIIKGPERFWQKVQNTVLGIPGQTRNDEDVGSIKLDSREMAKYRVELKHVFMVLSSLCVALLAWDVVEFIENGGNKP